MADWADFATRERGTAYVLGHEYNTAVGAAPSAARLVRRSGNGQHPSLLGRGKVDQP